MSKKNLFIFTYFPYTIAAYRLLCKSFFETVISIILYNIFWYVTKDICEIVAEYDPWILEFVLDQYENQKMYWRADEGWLFKLKFIPDQYTT